MDTATTFTLALAVVFGIPTLFVEAARWRLPRVRLSPRLGGVVALLVLLRLTPAGAAVPPPAERIELPQNPPEPAPPEAPEAPSPPARESPVYVVAAGDSLWAIACRHLAGDGGRPTNAEIDRYWREIYRANRAIIGDDPDLIFPGQRLVLPAAT